jgi:hypothetical protein
MRLFPLIKAILSCAFLFLASVCASAATPQEFYRQALEIKGINAFAATCQSAHETGYWTSALWKQARNGAGIKADKKWLNSGKPHMKKQSHEYVGGKKVYRTFYFRAYKSLPEFLADYGAKIKRDYPLSSKHADTMWGFFAALRKGRYGAWATNPKYFEHMADKAIHLAPILLGANWKEQLAREYMTARSRNLLTPNDIAVIEKKFKAAGIKTL